MRWIAYMGLVVALAITTGRAEEPSQSNSAPQNDPAPASKSEMQSIVPKLPDYSGDFWSRSYLTGDWGGERTRLAEHGISFKLDVTQVFQGNARGGKSTNSAWTYSGSADLFIEFDTARMGLWPGGQFTLHGETQFGEVLDEVGSINPVNFDAIRPGAMRYPGLTTLTEAYLLQALSEKLVLALGKIDATGLADVNEFAYSEQTQFLNGAFRANPAIGALAPIGVLAGVVTYMPTPDVQLLAGVLDANGSASETGFNTFFHSPRGVTVAGQARVTVRPFGLVGHQLFGMAWSNKEKRAFNRDARLFLPTSLFTLAEDIRALRGDTRPDDWALWYNFDQYVYQEHEDPTQGVGFFGRFGYTTGKANPIEQFYSFGVGGKGIVPTRDNDRFGLGYYYVKLSEDLPSVLGLDSEQGIELFYNFAVTPALTITPDVQYIIDPGGGAHSDALVVGIRMQMSF
jgi:porin